jgi:aminotransferase
MNTYHFADRAVDVPGSGIGFMMRYAAKYPDVLSLGQGTPLFPTPRFIYEYLNNRSKTDGDIGMYSGAKIEKELKDLIADRMEKEFRFKPGPGEIYLTVGGIGGLFAALLATLDKGDEIIYFDPSYPLHISQIHIAQAKPVFVSYREDDGWRIDLDLLERSITPKTRAILLTNPNNPTGTVLSQSEVHRLAEIVIEHNVVLILDEAYEFLTYETPFFSPLRIPELRDRVIVSRSFSKEYAMTGWRIGYVYAHPDLIGKINDIHVYFSISPATPSIVAAIAALSDPQGEAAKQEFIGKFTESREAICQRLDALGKMFSYQKPQGAYYAFPRITGLPMDELEFAKLLVDEAKVITIPGTSMGPSGKQHLRMSFAADTSLIHQAFDRIDGFTRKHGLL